MAFIDRAISVISPRWSAERAAWRKIEASYRGGVPTRTSESWQRAEGYRFGNSADRMLIGNARDRAYQAYKNNPVARTLVQTETDNVIGDGLNYQPSSSSEAWNREAKDRYYDWLENCSVRGPDVHTGCEIQRLLWDRSRVAGDIGWILVNRDYIDKVTGTSIVKSRIQVVPAENIATPDGMFADPAVYDGIRFDSWGAPSEYFVKTTDDRTGGRDFKTIAARDFVYLGHFTEPNQARPETCYVTIFELLSHLDRYVDAVSLAAWMAAAFGIVFKQATAATQFSALPSITNSQGNQQKAITIENGMVKYIGTDEEVAQVQATQPMQQTPEFVRTMYRMLGQPFDMPLEVIAKDMSTCTFASARIGLLPFYRSCRIKAARFGSRWSRTIRWWLSRERFRADDDPNKWDNEFPEDFWTHDLLPNEWDYTDPVSEVQGDMLQCDAGFKSPQQVISEHGRDAKLITQQRRDWMALTDGLPQLFSTMSREAPPKPAEASTSGPPADVVKAYARAYTDLLLASQNGDVDVDEDGAVEADDSTVIADHEST